MKAIFVFAHPDDESFSTGGTIAKLTMSGAVVKLITATKGEVGLVGNPPICKQEDLGRVREKELRDACKVLGISKIYFLGHIDSTLARIGKKILVEQILSILEKEKPDIVVTFDKEGGSKHPDHIQIGLFATEAFAKYSNTIKKHVRLYHRVNPDWFIQKLRSLGLMYFTFGKIRGVRKDEISTAVDVSKVAPFKIKAAMCHKTQHKDWERLVKRMRHKEFAFEYFKLVSENRMGYD